jgi:hypothetical protein
MQVVFRIQILQNFKRERWIDKNKIDFYATKQTIKQDENKESNKKTIEEGAFIFLHFNDKLT